MAQGVDGAETFLERRCTHRGGAHHVAARVDIAGVGDDLWEVLEDEPDAFDRDAVGEWMVAG
jgi:hypothetical protein